MFRICTAVVVIRTRRWPVFTRVISAIQSPKLVFWSVILVGLDGSVPRTDLGVIYLRFAI